MALIIETLAAEDLELGVNTTTKTHPAGGNLLGHQISLSTFSTVGAAGEAVTDTWDPGSISNVGIATVDVTVSGAEIGDKVLVSFDAISQANSDENAYKLWLSANVTANDTVTVVLANLTGTDVTPGSGTLSVLVFKHR